MGEDDVSEKLHGNTQKWLHILAMWIKEDSQKMVGVEKTKLCDLRKSISIRRLIIEKCMWSKRQRERERKNI